MGDVSRVQAPASAEGALALEKAAHDESRQLVAIVESTEDAIVSKTLEGKVTSWNPAAEKMFGYTAAEMIGRSIGVLIPPDRADEETMILRRMRNGERLTHFETVRRRRDGTLFPVSVTLSPIWGLDAAMEGPMEIVGISKIVRDLTELKQTQATVEREQRFGNSLIESMPGLFYLHDRAGRFLRWNLTFERVSGYSADEIAKMHPLDFFRGDEKVLLERQIAEVFEDGESSVEASLVGRNGAGTPCFFSAKRIVFDGLACFLGVGVNITQRRRAQEDLRTLNASLERKVAERTAELETAKERAEAADRLKSSFLATMSHELRTPLNSILGFTGMVLQELPGPLNPEQAKQLGMVQGSAQHLLELINDVLDISKIEAGQLEVRHLAFDLASSVERVSASVRPLAAKKDLDLRVVIPVTLPAMTSDRRRVEQILINLLNNAIKFTDRGEVTLTVDVVDDGRAGGAIVRFRVADTGVGMLAADQANLFRPFRQIDCGLQRQHEGTGLGLAICHRLSGLLGGGIAVESTWGQGSLFTVELPLDGAGPGGAAP